MPYVHNFPAVTPPPRYDSTAWTDVEVEETDDVEDGTWTQIADLSIDEDATPGTPDPIDLTISTATLAEGFFRFRFRDAAGSLSQYGEPVASPAGPHLGLARPEILPTVAELSAKMRARTLDRFGNQVGTFNDDTRPTGAQAEVEIHTALDVLTGHLGRVPAPLAPMARQIVLLRAAMGVETSYWPQEVTGQDNAYAAYERQFEHALAGYLEAAAKYPGWSQGGNATTPGEVLQSAGIASVVMSPYAAGVWTV